MSYRNSQHEGRLVQIPVVRDAFARLSSSEVSCTGCILLEGCDSEVIHKICEDKYPDLYHVPFLFHVNGVPWAEANAYLLGLMRDKVSFNQRFDDVRRRASKLLDYLLFCERENIDWMDFSGARPLHRPTYRYFHHLVSAGVRSSAVINQYTAVVYQFYKYVSMHWCDLDMRRVDTTKQVRFLIQGARGARLIDTERRSQTRRIPPSSSVPIGFVREDGEDLRPLSNPELDTLLCTISDVKEWSTVERLILLISLMTGARKQTVLTIRLKNLKAFSEENLGRDGTYKLNAGPYTGIDTKNDKAQILYVPRQLAEEMVVLANSPMMKRRREKFHAQLKANYPGLSMDEEDMYLFLSNQGNCYYMATSDPRYALVKSPQTGQVTDTIKRKLVKKVLGPFPGDFTYHWLRATFAFQLYQRLQVLVNRGDLKLGEDIDFIQKRLHHEARETTENYLKLFRMTQDKVVAQETWEKELFGGGCAVLGVEK